MIGSFTFAVGSVSNIFVNEDGNVVFILKIGFDRNANKNITQRFSLSKNGSERFLENEIEELRNSESLTNKYHRYAMMILSVPYNKKLLLESKEYVHDLHRVKHYCVSQTPWELYEIEDFLKENWKSANWKE